MNHSKALAGLILSGSLTAAAMDLIAIGDSITSAAGASNPTKGWADITSKRRIETIKNLSYSSANISDLALQAYGPFTNAVYKTTSPTSIDPDMQFVVLPGYNDMRDWGTNSIYLSHFEKTLDAIVGWLSIPHTNKVFGRSGLAKTTGDWATFEGIGPKGTPVALESQQVGATYEVELSGRSIYICYLARAFPANPWTPDLSGLPFEGGGLFSVTVDGELVGSARCSDAYGNRKAITGTDPFIPSTIDQAPHLFKLGGLADGLHKVRLTVQRGETPTTIVWSAGSSALSNSDKLPNVCVGLTLRMPKESYINHSANGSDLAVDAFNAVISRITTDWFDAGASVLSIDFSGFYDPKTHVSTDGVHPNDFGHLAISNAFVSSRAARSRIVRLGPSQSELEVLSPVGSNLSVQRSEDLLNWVDIEGSHRISIPQEKLILETDGHTSFFRTQVSQ